MPDNSALQNYQMRPPRGTSPVVVGEWVARVQIWRRFKLLLELRDRCASGQFSAALRESTEKSILRDCIDLVRIDGWYGEA